MEFGELLFEGGFGFVFFCVDAQAFVGDGGFFGLGEGGGFLFAVVVESFLGFEEFVAAGGLVAGEALDGLMVVVGPVEGVGLFEGDLGFDLAEVAGGAVEEPGRLDEFMEQLDFDGVFGMWTGEPGAFEGFEVFESFVGQDEDAGGTAAVAGGVLG